MLDIRLFCIVRKGRKITYRRNERNTALIMKKN